MLMLLFNNLLIFLGGDDVNMKKNVIRICFLLAAVFVISACNGGNNAATNNDAGNIEARQQETNGDDDNGTTPVEPDNGDEPAANGGATGANHLVWAHGAYPPSMDPSLTNDMPSAQIMAQVYSRLFIQDADLNIHGELATDYEFIDAQTLRVTLRDDVYFHNGQRMTAEDVAFTLERAGSAPQVAIIMDMIDTVDIVNDYEVIINLEFPFAPILSHLAHTAASIVSREVVERLGDEEHGLAPVGTGRFMVTEMVTGDRLELERFDDHFDRNLPVLERITIRIIPDESMRALEIEAGAVDMITNVGFVDIERLQGNDNINMWLSPDLSTNFIGFNCQRAPFDDVRVRQAIAYAIDNEAILANVHRGVTTPVNGPLADVVWGSISSELPGFPHNPARAIELLEEAGFPDGFETTIWLNETVERTNIANIVQQQLMLVGIDVEIEILEWGAYLAQTGAGEHDMFLLGWVSVTGDPDYGLFPVYHTDSWGDPGNRSRYSNPEVDRLIELGRTETDFDRRLEYYAEAQRIIAYEVPTMWLNQGVVRFATTSRWNGFEMHPAGHHTFHLMYATE